MFLVGQLILLVLVSIAFTLLLRMYRKQNAIEESFLCSILLMAAGCFTPEALLLIPVIWWGFTVLWADGLRVYLASICGIMLVLFYATLFYLFLPDSVAVVFVRDRLFGALSRTFCYTADGCIPSLLWLVIAAVAVVFGLWAMIAHMTRFTRANVRIQNFLMVAVPFFLLSLLSTLFPATDGNSMLFVLFGASLFLQGLYIAAYGFPRIRLPQRRRKSPNRRKWKRRSPYAR